MNLAMARTICTAGASTAVAVLLLSATAARGTLNSSFQKTAVLHATVTITGGLSFTGSYDDRLPVAT